MELEVAIAMVTLTMEFRSSTNQDLEIRKMHVKTNEALTPEVSWGTEQHNESQVCTVSMNRKSAASGIPD